MKKALTILLAVAMMFCFSATAFAADFTDTADVSKEAQNAINKVAALGIVEGYEDGSFKPAANITRAEFAKMADIAAGLEKAAKDLEGAQSSYKDVKTNVWYTGWINLASAQGYVKGYENGTYGPNNNITYAEVTTVLMRLLGYNDNLTGPWPINYINQATKLDVLDDVDGFSANVPATRANVAIMLAETLDKNMVKWVSDENEFQDKTKKDGKDDVTYKLIEDSFDGSTTEGATVTAINVQDEVDGEYQIATDKGQFNADATTAIAGVEPYALVGRQVTIINDDDEKLAAYVQVDDEIIEVAKAEAASGTNAAKKIKLDGKTYDRVEDAEAGAINMFTDKTAGYNTTGYALINDDDEVVAADVDSVFGPKYNGTYSVVTDVDTEDEDDCSIEVNDTDTIEADNDDAIFIKAGKRIAAADIKVGDVIVKNTAVDGEGNEVVDGEIYGVIADPSVKGAVTRERGNNKVTIGGTEYVYEAGRVEFNGDYEKQPSATSWKDLYNDEVAVYVNTANAIQYFVNDNEDTTANYGIVLDKADGSGFDSNKVNSVTLFTKDGKTTEFNFKDNNAKNEFAALNGANTSAYKGQVVEYELDNEGAIKHIRKIADKDKVVAGKVDVSNNKYVDYNGRKVVASDAVIFNVEDDYEVSTMTKADLLKGDTIEASPVFDGDEEDPSGPNYLYIVLNDDGEIEMVAVTNFGGESTVEYSIIDEIYSYDGDDYITFVGNDTEYELATSLTSADEGKLVSYKLSGKKVKNVEAVEDMDGYVADKVISTYTDGLVTLKDGNTFELTTDCVYVQYDKSDAEYTFTTAAKALKADNTIAYILDADDDDHPAELVIVIKE